MALHCDLPFSLSVIDLSTSPLPMRCYALSGNTPMKLCKDIYLQDLLIAAKPPDLKGKLNRDFRDQKKTGAKKDGYKNKAAEWVGVAARDNDLTSMQQHMGDFGPKQQQLINTPDFLGMYPLHYAAACAKSAVVKCLLDCKADMHVQSRTGNTPLHYAYNNNKKVRALVLVFGFSFRPAVEGGGVSWRNGSQTPGTGRMQCFGSTTLCHAPPITFSFSRPLSSYFTNMRTRETKKTRRRSPRTRAA